MRKDIVYVMEVGEVCVYLHYPIWLHQYDSADEDPARVLGKEGLDLYPSDDIVQGPGCVERDRADRQPPSVDWRVEEDPEAMPDTEEQLIENMSEC